MEELKQVVESLEVSDKSKKVYLSLVNRLGKFKFKFPLKKIEKESYVSEFLSQFPKESTRLDLLNLIIVIRTKKDLETKKLKELRSSIQKERVTNNVVTMKEKGKELETYESFNEELDKAHESKQWTKYIVNYLWKTFSVRNEDVNVVIVKSMKEANANPDKNYLVIQGSKIKYIRNKYKTVKKYGKQSHIISDSNFVSAVKKHGEGELLKGSQIGNVLRKLMIRKMGEADVMKMMIDYYFDKGDTEAINKIADTRGTSIDTIKKFYNVNAQEEIIREI